MLENRRTPTDQAELRRRAEELAAEKTEAASDEFDSLSADDARRLLHELQVQRFELEIQNDELRGTQVELELARDRYFQLYHLAPIGYATLDLDGVLRQANLTLAITLGVERGKLVGQPFARFIDAGDQDAFYLHRRALAGDGQSSYCELRVRRADGSTFWALLDCTRTREEGDDEAIRVMVSNISARHDAQAAANRAMRDLETAGDELRAMLAARTSGQQALHESEIFGRRILDSVPAEIAVIAANGGILAVNEPWLRFALENSSRPGLPAPGTGVGDNYLAACLSDADPETADFPAPAAAARGIRTVLDGDASTFTMEYPCHGPDRQRWFEMNVTPFGPERLGAVITHVDITKRRQAEATRMSLEAQLRESQKMEAIGTLAGGIAHDFNNIIAIILGNVELVRDAFADNVRAARSLENIWTAALRARDLVKRILTFSRHQPSERKVIVLAPVVEDSMRLMKATLPARIRLVVDVDTDSGTVLANPIHLEQVLINLVTNAAQAIPEGAGRIGVRVDAVDVDATLLGSLSLPNPMPLRRAGRAARISVSDNGIGMDAATVAKVFDPFFTTKPVDEGTGLGLSVVHGIIDAHDGGIAVRSAPGEGTAFTIYLPLAGIGAASDLPLPTGGAPVLTAPSPGDRILYIDDESSLVELVTHILERGGYRVHGYTSAEEALRVFRAAPDGFDLVVSDYNMPRLSGLDVARQVRAIRPGLRVALISGYVDEKLIAAAHDAGVKDVIFKADAVGDLCAELAGILHPVGPKGP